MLGLLSLQAGTFPSKPIRVVVPFAPGGGSDTFVRILQTGIRQAGLMEDPFVVLNVPGAGGTIGSRRVKQAHPDGYTLLNLHDGIFSAKYSGQALYGAEAFVPVAATARAHILICVGAESPYQSLTEVLEAARENPGKVLFGANFGATSHFAGLRLEHQVEGAKFAFVPAGGGAKRFAAMKGGHLDVSTFTIAEYLGFRDGGLRAVAILSDERHPQFAEIPTAREQGLDVVWDQVQFWWAPLGTPPDRVAYFADVLAAAMKDPWVTSRLQELHYETLFASGEELSLMIQEGDDRMRELSLRQEIQLPNVPGMLGALLLFLVVLDGVQRRGKFEVVDISSSGQWGGLLLGLALLGLYALLLGSRFVPYWMATLLFLIVLGAGLLRRTGRMAWGTLIITSVVLSLGCDWVFRYGLGVDLP